MTAAPASKKAIKKLEILFIAILISISFCTFAGSQVTAQISDLSVSVSPGSANMDSGQSQTFTATASGGSGSYSSYKWYFDSTLQSGITTSSFTYSPGSSTGTHSITVTVTDSSGATSALSYPSSVTVYSTPSILTQPYSTAINNGQSTTLTSQVTGGTGSFSWQWYDINGQISGKSGTGSTASYVVSTPSSGIYVIFTDTGTGSATPTATASSNPPVTVTVNDILSVNITPPNQVTLAVGQPQTLTAFPTGGSGTYVNYQWYQNGVVIPNQNSPTYTFNPSSTDSVSIYATVTDTLGSTSPPSNTVSVSVNQIAITVTPPTGGSIVSGNGTSVNYGDSVSFSVTPNIGYHIASITIDGNSVTVTNPTGQEVKFINVQTNHTIAATFAANTYTLTVNQSPNGQITPGTTIINYGGSQSFSITANPGYYTVDVTINGNSVGSISSYTFTNVQAAYTIAATFAPISSPTPTPIPTPTPTPTPSPTPSPTPTPTSEPTSSPTPTPTPTNVTTPTTSPTSSPTPPPSPTPSPSPTTVSATINGENIQIGIKGNITAQQMSNIPTSSDQTTETVFSFTITGPSGTVGFGNLTIPKNAIPYGSTPVVYVDGSQASDQGYAQDANNYYVWFTIHFSTHQLTVQFTAAPQTSQFGSPGLEYALIIPVAAVILVPTVIAVKRSKRKTSKREIKTKSSTLQSKETKTSNTINANKAANPIKNTPPIKSTPPIIQPKQTLRSTVTNQEQSPNKEAKSIKSTLPIIEPKETLRRTVTNQEPSPKQNVNGFEQKSPTLSCNYHFGYLRDLPEGTEMPNECYICTKLIECKTKT